MALALLLLIAPSRAAAVGEPIWLKGCVLSIVQPQWVRARCSRGAATRSAAAAEVTVFAYVPLSVQANPAALELPTTRATWLFYAGAIEYPTRDPILVLRFTRREGAAVAELYDDRDADGKISLRGDFPDEPQVSEAGGRWTVRVTAPAGWWTDGDRVNYDLDIEVDGGVEVVGTGAQYQWRYLPLLHTDGAADFRVTIRSAARTDYPRFQLTQAFPPIPRTSAIFRSNLMVNEGIGKKPLSGSILWPHLGDSGADDYRDLGAPINVRWTSPRILAIGHFVPQQFTDRGWFITSITQIEAGASNVPNFENPFAFYDLARRGDGYPDLQVRNWHSPPGDLFGRGRLNVPLSAVRYTWDQDHSHTWDFKVDVLGRHALERSLSFGEFQVATVPYEELPRWVVEHPWDVATFVAAEETDYWTSEGIYEWAADEIAPALVSGADGVRAARERYVTLPAGLRGEYTARLNDRPYLYMSPLDGGLHLWRADGGMSVLRNGRTLRYESIGGEVIDRWVLTADGQEEASLSYLGDQLVLHDASGVRIKTVTPQRAPELLLPPTDPEQWTRLRQVVTAARLGIPADDLAALFERITGAAVSLPGASLSDVSRQAAGFRFALHLPPRAPLDAAAPPWATGLEPGEYLVRYDSAPGYRVEPLLPPQPTVERVTAAQQPARALEPVELRATISNPGGLPARDLPVTFIARRSGAAGGQAIRAGTVRLDVPGGASAEARLSWSFPAGGEWIVTASPDEPPAAVQDGGTGATVNVAVQPPPSAGAWDLVRAQGRGGPFGLILVALLSAALAAAATAGALPFVARRRARAITAAR